MYCINELKAAEQLFGKALEKLNVCATRQRKSTTAVYACRATCLLRIVKLKMIPKTAMDLFFNEEELNQMLKEARKLFLQVIEAEPNRITLFTIDLANTCVILADLSEGVIKANYLAEAEKIYLEAESSLKGNFILKIENFLIFLFKGKFAFDLAIIAAMNNKPESCRQWLYASLVEGKLPSVNTIQADGRLMNMHVEAWYQVYCYYYLNFNY